MRPRLNQNQFDALVSFVYNLGAGAVSADTGIGRALRAPNGSAPATRCCAGTGRAATSSPGSTRRRRAERALFLRRVSANPLAVLTAKERGWCREYDRLLATKRAGRDTLQAHRRRVALRAAMERRRKAIWHAAEAVAGGWEQVHRRARYRALLARSA